MDFRSGSNPPEKEESIEDAFEVSGPAPPPPNVIAIEAFRADVNRALVWTLVAMVVLIVVIAVK
jgi:hypothetical protein